MLRSMYRNKNELMYMIIDCGNALRWSRVSHALLLDYEQYSLHWWCQPNQLWTPTCMVSPSWKLTTETKPGVFSATNHIHSSTRVYSLPYYFQCFSTASNAVLLYSQLNGLLTTVGPHSARYIHASLLQFTAFCSLGWYHTKRHNINCKFRQ